MEMNSSSTDISAAPPDGLDDNLKRLIVVGVCLHNIVSPRLRIYVNDELLKQYHSLVTSHDIDKQTFKSHHSSLPISNVKLNYGTINNNKVTFGKEKEKYDYAVKNAVDLSKLVLQPYLAKYIAFDSKCDSSALLGLIEKINTFHPDVRTDAEKIRDCVRNEIAHPDLNKWDSAKYADSFSLLKHLITNLALDPAVNVTVMGNLNIWEVNGISYLSGTPLGLELYESSCKFIKDTTTAVEEKYRILESCYENLKSKIDTLTEDLKTESEDTECGEIAIDKVEFANEDFDRTVELKAIVKTTLQNLEDACIPKEIYDVIQKGSQAIFFYLQRAKPINYKKYSIKKLSPQVKKTGNVWDDHHSTTVRVCILEGTSEGRLTNLDIRVLKALLDSPSWRQAIESTLFIVTGFSHEEEHTNAKVSHTLSREISSKLHLPVNVNTVYGRLYPHDHPEIASRMSTLFQQQLLHGLKDVTDKIMEDIKKSEEFIGSDEFYQCKTVLSDKVGPFSMPNCSYFLEKEVKIYQTNLYTFVLAEFEKQLRMKLKDRLIENLPTHYWADLTKRTTCSTHMLQEDRGNFHFSDFIKFLKNKIESQQDEIISLEINDCKETHLKEIRKIKDYLTKTLHRILVAKGQENEENGRILELELILNRFDPEYELSIIEDKCTIYLTDHKQRLAEIKHTLSLFLANWNSIEYGEFSRNIDMELLTGMLKSGDRVINSLQQCSTVSFFLRDSEWLYFVTCKHIIESGSQCFIENTNNSVTARVPVFHQFNVANFDIAVFKILDRSLVCMPGIRSEIGINNNLFSTDLMILPIGLPVYKWGAGSGLTHGRFMGASLQGPERYVLVHIQNDSANPFALHGDSGSLICFTTELSTVVAAYVLIGVATNYLHSDIPTYCCVRVRDVLSFIACHSPGPKPCFSTNTLWT